LPEPFFPEPSAREIKPAFETIPQAVLADVGRALGSGVVSGEIARGSFSAAANFILRLQDGRKVFAKGNHPEEMAHGTQTLRQEIFVYENARVLREVAPRYLGFVHDGDEDGWMLGLWEFIDAPRAGLDRVLETVAKFHAAREDAGLLPGCRDLSYIKLFFAPGRKWMRPRDEAKVRTEFLALFEDGEAWLARNLQRLIALQEKAAAVSAPEGLLHGDLRMDNVIGGARAVDWPNACRGPVIFDLLFLCAGLEAEGAGMIEDFLNVCPGPKTKPEDAHAVAAAISGMLADQARRAVPEKMPRLRWVQKSQLLALLKFLARAGQIESIPRMVGETGAI
jgi:hypothetical protein